MKRLLMSFLMVAVLTPMMVCGMVAGMQEAQASEACHEAMANDLPDAVMFMFDCMNVDFQAAQDDAIAQPNLKISKVIYAPVSAPFSGLLFADPNNIRGSPPDQGSALNAWPSLILTTGRFRI